MPDSRPPLDLPAITPVTHLAAALGWLVLEIWTLADRLLSARTSARTRNAQPDARGPLTPLPR